MADGGELTDLAHTLAARYDGLFVDLDGVIYRGDQVIPSMPEVIERLRLSGSNLLFLTNNSSKTPRQVVDKLASLGIEAGPEEILTSGVATAAMLEDEGAAGMSAFVIGEQGILEALGAIGVRVVEDEPPPATTDLVIVGWDRSVDYGKLRTASLLVQAGARLVATNADSSYPAPDGLWPGAGAILAAVVTTTGAVPTVVGKPARPLFDAAAKVTGAVHPLVVGDRLDTDVAGAAAMGWDSLLVLSGASAPHDMLRGPSRPTYVGWDLGAVLQDRPRVVFRTATPSDRPGIASLLTSAGLRVDSGLNDPRVLFSMVVGQADPREQVVATARLQRAGEHGILRSVAVRDDLRTTGIGTLTVAAAIARARDLALFTVSLFTETAEPFFARLGFRPVDRDALPEAVDTTTRGGQDCASAPAMMLDL